MDCGNKIKHLEMVEAIAAKDSDKRFIMTGLGNL